jgi:ubiquinone/menaquinone biosynthesis C-methylase UbiE
MIEQSICRLIEQRSSGLSNTPPGSSKTQSSYFIDAENAAEMARLSRQAKLQSERLGLFPEKLALERKSAILDIACGSGEWALEVAQKFPDKQITGIDISELMISYARYIAESRSLTNVHFQVMDVRQPFIFKDASFDLINARLITSFLTTAMWPVLLRDCFRLLRPGGIMCSTEIENMGVTTSPALAHYNHLFVQTMRKAGQCFTPEGDQMGITAAQPRLLADAGFQHIEQQAFSINFSAGIPGHEAVYDNLKTLMKLLQPFIVRYGLATQQEIEGLYERALAEMGTEDFCAVAFFQRVWGEKL